MRRISLRRAKPPKLPLVSTFQQVPPPPLAERVESGRSAQCPQWVESGPFRRLHSHLEAQPPTVVLATS